MSTAILHLTFRSCAQPTEQRATQVWYVTHPEKSIGHPTVFFNGISVRLVGMFYIDVAMYYNSVHEKQTGQAADSEPASYQYTRLPPPSSCGSWRRPHEIPVKPRQRESKKMGGATTNRAAGTLPLPVQKKGTLFSDSLRKAGLRPIRNTSGITSTMRKTKRKNTTKGLLVRIAHKHEHSRSVLKARPKTHSFIH